MTRILLVEPDEVTARAVSASLAGHADWEVTRVSSVLEAIRTAGEGTFDAAVLDYEQPDGTGLDILDFLRIGSPGIRIVVLSARVDPDIALHALSHGAGEFLVKDSHLELELPRRMDALLQHIDGKAALVETIFPNPYDTAVLPAHVDTATSLQACVRDLVGANTLAAAVFDHRGRPVAVKLLPDLDADGVGFALATLHGQVGALWTYGGLRPTGYTLLIDVDGGLVAVTAIPGTYLVALLFASPISRERALEKLEGAAARLTDMLHA